MDALYNDPPLSTEQILHPERFPADVPLILEVPNLIPALGETWREIEHNVLGEWYTRLTLDEFLEEDVATRAAEGWGGDYYIALYHDEDEKGAWVLMTIWDTAKDAEEFYLAFDEYGNNRFGDGSLSTLTSTWESDEGLAYLERWGNQTLWILAPGIQEYERIREALEFPLSG